MLTLLKRVARERCPEWVAAYHQLRMNRASRRFPTGMSPYGFTFTGPAGMHDGTFEPTEAAFLSQRLPRCDIFVDVGANAGYFTCLARQHRRHAIAVEPSPQNLSVLFRNLVSNGWTTDVEVYPVALGATMGLKTLYGDGTSASVIPRWAGVSDAWRRIVPMCTLDELIAHRFPGDRLLIKIDVEGFERDVLQGARALVARTPSPTWLVEICFDENLGESVNPYFREVFDLFWDAGYSALSLDAGRAVEPHDVERWLAAGGRDFGSVSYVFERGAIAL